MTGANRSELVSAGGPDRVRVTDGREPPGVATPTMDSLKDQGPAGSSFWAMVQPASETFRGS